jgi:thymidylate synthase (FAD)
MDPMIEVVKPGYEWSVMSLENFEYLEEHIECCGRVCYKSEDRITRGSAEKFVGRICRNNHESVLEHATATAFIICSRACSHQLVRHRLGSYSQESMRYVNYGNDGALKVVCPPSIGLEPGVYDCLDGLPIGKAYHWLSHMEACFAEYKAELDAGVRPGDARYVLPNATKTELAVTFNIRQWRHFFKTRCDSHAQWEIRDIATDMCTSLSRQYPAMFGDILEEENATS